MPLIIQIYYSQTYDFRTPRISKLNSILQSIVLNPPIFIPISARSGKNAELITMKNLKRSKNMGRKKKAKTQQTENQQNKLIEPVQEKINLKQMTVNCKEAKSTNGETNITPTIEQQKTRTTLTMKSEDVPAYNSDDKINRFVDKQTTGKYTETFVTIQINLSLWKKISLPTESDTSQEVCVICNLFRDEAFF